jgi:hypothetical protein
VKRRLLFVLLWLLLLDRAVPPLLERAERRHYESGTVFRFENSDLFALGPFVDYLRDHPQHGRRRVVFFGNSMLFGYFLSPAQAIPAQYQRFDPEARVYNAAINGQELGTGYLVGKDILGDVDVLYVQVIGAKANPLLPSLIPIDDADLRRFQLTPPNRVEQRLQSALGRVWNLYRLNYRMQAALFGTSTRVHLYMYKRDLAHLFRVPLLRPDAVAEGGAAGVSVRAPRIAGPVASGSETQRLMIDLAKLARARGKRVVFIAFEWDNSPLGDAEAGAFNASFAPWAETVIVHLPAAVTIDGEHANPAASARVAELLAQHEREVAR